MSHPLVIMDHMEVVQIVVLVVVVGVAAALIGVEVTRRRLAPDAAAPADTAPADTAPADAPPAQAPAGAEALTTVTGAWEAILATLGRQSKRVQAIVGQGTPVALTDGTLVLRFPFDFHAQQAQQDATAAAIATTIESVVGTRYRIRAVVGDDGPDPPEVVVDDEASAVINHEAAEAAGDVVDDDQAHDEAIRVLAEGLGAEVVDDSRA